MQCCVSAEVSEPQQKDDFYGSLTGVLRNKNRSVVIILMGDFNAQLGSDYRIHNSRPSGDRTNV